MILRRTEKQELGIQLFKYRSPCLGPKLNKLSS